MDKKNIKKVAVESFKSQRGKKKAEASTAVVTRSQKAKEAKVITLSSETSDTSGSDGTDEDYAEFLKAYKSPDFYPLFLSSDEGESQATVESKMKPAEVLKIDSDSEHED
ncbi:hypothetical protein L195_g054644 [Trifolium pratense]|uniref:Uncharacterized protein n=1 Tax=Trifolium pratense TaxID=57577 RepID=A0A2K3KH88_TRIPR|nr:hypothetical protein L195_g054644 [Trifolium pratense]